MAIRDEPIGDKWRVQTADPYDLTKMPAVGILISKSTPTVGVIQVVGQCDIAGLDWNKFGYYVGTDGSPVWPKPSASGSPSGMLYLQIIGKSVSSDILYLDGNLSILGIRN